MGEWFFKLDNKRVKAGEVKFVAQNDGDVDHELIVFKSNLKPNKMPITKGAIDLDGVDEFAIGSSHHGDDDAKTDNHDSEDKDEASKEDKEDDDHGDEKENTEDTHIKAGATKSYTVDLKPGKYVLLCSIPGHYQSGQYVSLTVE